MLDQLVLPKLQKAIANWNPRKDDVSLQTLVFPWLPLMGLRMEELISDACRRFRSLLRAWTAPEGVPKDLAKWKDVCLSTLSDEGFCSCFVSCTKVFDPAEWEGMLTKYVLPKLGAALREDLKINPRNQNMEPLHWVLAWEGLFRASTFSQLFESGFFPQWLNILHIWLVQPNPNFAEVADWSVFNSLLP